MQAHPPAEFNIPDDAFVAISRSSSPHIEGSYAVVSLPYGSVPTGSTGDVEVGDADVGDAEVGDADVPAPQRLRAGLFIIASIPVHVQYPENFTNSITITLATTITRHAISF